MMIREIYGYKAFNSDLTDNYGNIYEMFKHYYFPGNIKFKNSGFHFCKNLEDVLRYYDSFEKNIIICLVKGYGTIDQYDDDYYGYYDMYSSSDFIILKILTRKEILDIMLKTNEERICRFVSGYKLTEEEISLILNKYPSEIINDYILYYQLNDKKVFERKIKLSGD